MLRSRMRTLSAAEKIDGVFISHVCAVCGHLSVMRASKPASILTQAGSRLTEGLSVSALPIQGPRKAVFSLKGAHLSAHGTIHCAASTQPSSLAPHSFCASVLGSADRSCSRG